MHAYAALANCTQRFEQRRHIEDVTHALAVRLQQYGKRWITRGNGEQVIGSLALLPQGRTALCATPGQKQSPRGALTKFRGKQRCAAELTQDQVRGLVSIQQKQLRVGRGIAVGKTKYESIVAPHRFHIRTATGTNSAGDRHGPGRVNTAAK